MMRVRAVCLDVGWTLAYPRRSPWQIFAELCADAGAATTPEACEALIRNLARLTQAQAEEQFRGGARYADSDAEFARVFGQMGRLVFAQMGVEQGHDALMRRFLQTFWNEDNWECFPEVIDVLAALRGHGLRIGVLSNAPSDLPTFLARFGITPYLDFTVVSALEGIKKPDRRIFDVAVARAGVAPHEVVHVGDMYLEDILGGRAAGLHALLMERGPHALFPSFPESAGRPLAPDSVVNDLRQLIERLA